MRAQRSVAPAKPVEEKRTSAQIRAALNHVPDNDTLHSLIDKALTTISPKSREMFTEIRTQRAAEATQLRKQIQPAASRR